MRRPVPTLPVRMTIPNLITIGRLILVPVGRRRRSVGALGRRRSCLFLVAGISDGVDGFIARRFDLRTELGAYLDPLADKALLVSIYVTLAVVGVLPGWLAIVVVSRDLMIVGAVMLSWLMAAGRDQAALRCRRSTPRPDRLCGLVLAAQAFGIELERFGGMRHADRRRLDLASAGAYLGRWLPAHEPD